LDARAFEGSAGRPAAHVAHRFSRSERHIALRAPSDPACWFGAITFHAPSATPKSPNIEVIFCFREHENVMLHSPD